MCSYYDPETFDAGGVRSWVTCDPYNHEQTKTVHNNDKLSSCINACSKSFEKAKRAAEAGVDLSKRQDEYWFCHAVNFIEGELCEFVGEIGGYTYTPRGASFWLYPGLGSWNWLKCSRREADEGFRLDYMEDEYIHLN